MICNEETSERKVCIFFSNDRIDTHNTWLNIFYHCIHVTTNNKGISSHSNCHNKCISLIPTGPDQQQLQMMHQPRLRTHATKYTSHNQVYLQLCDKYFDHTTCKLQSTAIDGVSIDLYILGQGLQDAFSIDNDILPTV